MYISSGMDKKEAMKAVAKDLGISRREVYAALEREKEDNGDQSTEK
jgi:16S rRNA (cytidine1402-2'-O)-methyltransferase